MTTRNMILAAALAAGCNEGLEQKVDETQAPQGEVSEKSVSTETIPADYAVRIREASPDQNFYGQNGMIGCSADGFDRYLVHFPFGESQKKVESAVIVFDALSGTCASSYDDKICGLEMTVHAQPILSSWDAAHVKWNGLPNFSEAAEPIGQITFSVPYQGTTIVPLDVTEYVQRVAGKGQDYGFILKAANDTETTRKEQRLLHEDPTRVCGRGIQRDVLVGNPRLEVTYQ